MANRLEVEDVESVELELTTLCNARCKLCFRQSKLFPEKFKQPHVRDLAEIQTQLAAFKKLRRVELIGQMSDPLCYPKLPQLVRWLKQRGIQISLYTNGSFSRDWIYAVGRELRREDEVRLTVCGLDQKQHETYRCGTSLVKIFEACRVLRKDCHVHVVMTYLLFEYNRQTIESLRMKLVSKLFSETNFVWNNTFQPVEDFGVAPEDDVFTNSDQKQLLADIKQFASSHFADPSLDPVECPAAQKKHVFISCFGEVFPCWCFFEANYNLSRWSYADIVAKKHQCCRYCQKSIRKLVEQHGLGGA